MALGLKKKAQYFMSKSSGTGAVRFATDSWDIIQAEAKRISKYYEDNGVLPTDTPYAIYDPEGGDTDNVRTITLSDNTQIKVCIIGMCHDTLTTAYDNGGTKAGLTLGMVDSLGTTYKMNSSATNVGGWNGCDFRTTLNSTIFETLPQAVKDVIPYVDKLTSEGNKSATIITSSDKLFLLSLVEVLGTINRTSSAQASFAGEGTQYAFYANAPLIVDTTSNTFPAMTGTSGTCKSNGISFVNRFGETVTTVSNGYWTNYRSIKAGSYQGTTADTFRLRSPYYNGTVQFVYIVKGGNAPLTNQGANNLFPVSFAFCI